MKLQGIYTWYYWTNQLKISPFCHYCDQKREVNVAFRNHKCTFRPHWSTFTVKDRLITSVTVGSFLSNFLLAQEAFILHSIINDQRKTSGIILWFVIQQVSQEFGSDTTMFGYILQLWYGFWMYNSFVSILYWIPRAYPEYILCKYHCSVNYNQESQFILKYAIIQWNNVHMLLHQKR